MAGKIPTVHRDALNGGLTGDSAYKWALFVADEYLFDPEHHLLYDTFTAMAQSLKPAKGKAQVASFHSQALEAEIEKWSKQ